MKRFHMLLLGALGLVTGGWIYVNLADAPEDQRSAAAANTGPKETSSVSVPATQLKTISFVHFNDFHAHYQPRDYNGRKLSPLSLIRGYRDQVKAENPNTVFCSAGDEMEKGSIVDLLSAGAATIEIYKELGLDLRAVGNHDFAYGLETLKRFVTETSGIALCANHSVAKDYHQFEIDGVRIGVFSMVGKPWDERDRQYHGPYFKGVSYRYDFAAVAEETIRKHRKHVDLLFLLSHLGLDTDKEVAAAVEGLDFIIGGHSHTLMTRPVLSPRGTVIVQAGSYGQFVGRLDVMVDRSSRKMVAHRYSVTPVEPGNMTPHMPLEEKIREISSRYDANPEAPVATFDKELSKIGVAQLAGEAAIAVLKADAAVIDVDTVWGTLAAGPRTRQDLLDCFRVEIEPSGTHGFNSIMTADLPAQDWQVIKSSRNHRFILVGEPKAEGRQTLRVAIQRRTAMRIREFFPQLSALSSIKFEMEMWEVLAKHLASQKTSLPASVDLPK